VPKNQVWAREQWSDGFRGTENNLSTATLQHSNTPWEWHKSLDTKAYGFLEA